MAVILYVEDDSEQVLMMRMYLEKKNFTLVIAEDGREALDKIKNLRPDLILLDLFMPRLDGFGVMRAIKSNPQTAPIPIIILSAWPTSENRRRAEEAGAVDFVAKPYEPAYLALLIEKHLAIAQAADSASQ